MSMKNIEQEYQPILPPEETEQPEDGFVPYCGSEDAGSRKNPRLFLLIPGILLALAVIFIVVVLVGRNFNFYQKTLQGLKFDYRSGEIVSEGVLPEKGVAAESVAAQIGRKQVTADVAFYLLHEDASVADAVSVYHYVHNVNEDIVSAVSGTKGWIFSSKTEIHLPLKNGNPPVTEEYRRPLLSELFFGTESHDAYMFSCYDAFYAVVGGQNYVCEIWLMEDDTVETPSYYTLYRYYQDGKLAGVRVLSDADTEMEVYDIQSYTVG